jgi:hypothetical protein
MVLLLMLDVHVIDDPALPRLAAYRRAFCDAHLRGRPADPLQTGNVPAEVTRVTHGESGLSLRRPPCFVEHVRLNQPHLVGGEVGGE